MTYTTFAELRKGRLKKLYVDGSRWWQSGKSVILPRVCTRKYENMQDFYVYFMEAHNHFVCRDVFLALNEVLHWTYRPNQWNKIHAVVKVEQSVV